MTTASPDPVDDLIEFVARYGITRQAQGDLRPKALAYRLRRVAHMLELEMRRELADNNIDLWELELLACLLRAPDHELTAGALMSSIALTSGTITHRINRVQERGWVQRRQDPRDRRSILVSLTEAGRRRALDVLDNKTVVERDVLGVLDTGTLDVLNDALRTVLHRLERRAET